MTASQLYTFLIGFAAALRFIWLALGEVTLSPSLLVPIERTTLRLLPTQQSVTLTLSLSLSLKVAIRND